MSRTAGKVCCLSREVAGTAESPQESSHSTPLTLRFSTVSLLSVTDLQVIRSCPESAQALILLLLSAMSWLHMTAGECRGMQDSDTRTKRWFNGSFRAALSSLQHNRPPSDWCIPSAAVHRQLETVMTPQTLSTAKQQPSLWRVPNARHQQSMCNSDSSLCVSAKPISMCPADGAHFTHPQCLGLSHQRAALYKPTSQWPPRQSGCIITPDAAHTSPPLGGHHNRVAGPRGVHPVGHLPSVEQAAGLVAWPARWRVHINAEQVLSVMYIVCGLRRTCIEYNRRCGVCRQT